MVNPEVSRPTPEVVAIVSEAGGVGKTTTAVNLALALAAAGRTVLLMDLDPLGNAGRSLVRGSYGGVGIERALLDASLTRGMIAATEVPDLYLASGGPGLAGVEDDLAPMGDSRSRLYQALATGSALPMRFDHIIIDCPAAQGLLTLNALTAAHRVLLPLQSEPTALDELPVLLTTIGRLRAGFSHPFFGVYLLINMFSPHGAASDQVVPRSVIEEVRRDYGRMTLLTEIPDDGALQEAIAKERPLIVDTPSCPAAAAYLSLAAEWLTLAEPGDQPDGTWRFKARQERIAHYRDVMSRRIEAWMIDPSSLLYDEREAMFHQDSQVLEELFRVTQPMPVRESMRPGGRLVLAILLGGVLLIGLGLLVRPLIVDDQWRVELGTWLIGPDRYWEVGSLLLSRSDAVAYREIQLGTRLVGDNRERLMECGEQAMASDAPVACRIQVVQP